MITYVLTSDKYHHCLPGFAYLFNKMGGENQPVKIVGFAAPKAALPRNFSFMSLGKQEDYTWSAAALRFTELIQEDQFILLLEDYFFRRPVAWGNIQSLWDYMESHERVAKIDLSDDRLKLEYTAYPPIDNIGMVESGPLTNFQTSLQAAIWRKSFFARYLDKKENAWQFEKNGTKRLISDRKQSKAWNPLILGCKIPPMDYINAIGGEGNHPHVWALKRFPDWMINELRAKDLMNG